MKIKCVSSNVGTLDIPNNGSMTFGPNCFYVVSDEVGSYLRAIDPKSFKYIDGTLPEPKVTSGSVVKEYTTTFKTRLGFKNTALDPSDVEIKDLSVPSDSEGDKEE